MNKKSVLTLSFMLTVQFLISGAIASPYAHRTCSDGWGNSIAITINEGQVDISSFASGFEIHIGDIPFCYPVFFGQSMSSNTVGYNGINKVYDSGYTDTGSWTCTKDWSFTIPQGLTKVTVDILSTFDSVPFGRASLSCSLISTYGSGSGNGGSCLIKGTNILTPDGLKKIEDIQVGDTVIGYKDGKKTEAKVLGKSIHFGFWTIYYYKGSWFTDQHRVYTSPDEEAVSVVTVSDKTGTYTGYVYNIETETKNYFGENGLLIHNRKALCSEGACA